MFKEEERVQLKQILEELEIFNTKLVQSYNSLTGFSFQPPSGHLCNLSTDEMNS